MGHLFPKLPTIVTPKNALEGIPMLHPPKKHPTSDKINPPITPTKAISASCQKSILKRLAAKYRVSHPPKIPPQKLSPGTLLIKIKFSGEIKYCRFKITK